MNRLILWGFIFNFFPGCNLSPVETLVNDVKLVGFAVLFLLVAIAVGVWRK